MERFRLSTQTIERIQWGGIGIQLGAILSIVAWLAANVIRDEWTGESTVNKAEARSYALCRAITPTDPSVLLNTKDGTSQRDEAIRLERACEEELRTGDEHPVPALTAEQQVVLASCLNETSFIPSDGTPLDVLDFAQAMQTKTADCLQRAVGEAHHLPIAQPLPE